ncbi:hypothetical protein A3781_20570 [Bacillus badius]|nr:hypothetical protein A3781_20570 [Bacillus badius]
MQIKIIGIGVPRKLTVPITLVPIMELMVSIPLMIGLPAIEASIPHTDGNGILIMVWVRFAKWSSPLFNFKIFL